MMTLMRLLVLLNMLACKSRMVIHVAIGTVDTWVFVGLVIKLE